MVWWLWGNRFPLYCIRSTDQGSDQGSDQAITLADAIPPDEPQITLAVLVVRCSQDTIALHVHHDGVNGALVAAGIESHAVNDVRAGLGSVLNQRGADCSAGECGEVHRSGVVN